MNICRGAAQLYRCIWRHNNKNNVFILPPQVKWWRNDHVPGHPIEPTFRVEGVPPEWDPPRPDQLYRIAPNTH